MSPMAKSKTKSRKTKDNQKVQSTKNPSTKQQEEYMKTPFLHLASKPFAQNQARETNHCQ
jgi:hypothetical protein